MCVRLLYTYVCVCVISECGVCVGYVLVHSRLDQRVREHVRCMYMCRMRGWCVRVVCACACKCYLVIQCLVCGSYMRVACVTGGGGWELYSTQGSPHWVKREIKVNENSHGVVVTLRLLVCLYFTRSVKKKYQELCLTRL